MGRSPVGRGTTYESIGINVRVGWFMVHLDEYSRFSALTVTLRALRRRMSAGFVFHH